MKKRRPQMPIAAEKTSPKKYCCFKGYCMRAKTEEESVCLKAGGLMVNSCSDCK